MEKFRRKPWQYDFYKALAHTRKLYPGRRVRFKIPPRLDFSPGPVAGLEEAPDGSPALIVNLTALTGPSAPLPLHLTQQAQALARRGDGALGEFLALLGDRIIDLYQELMGRMKPEAAPQARALDHCFLAAAGVLTEGIRGRTMAIPNSGPQGEVLGKLPEASFFSAAQIWGMFPRSASGLEFLVEHVFGVTAKVEPLKGAWVNLPGEQRTILGRQKNQLGRDSISGGQVFDPAAGFTLKLGPLTREQYREFLPPPAGTKRGDLMAMIIYYAGADFTFSISFQKEGQYHG